MFGQWSGSGPEHTTTIMKPLKSIYTINVVNGTINHMVERDKLRSRCWGYYFIKSEAEQVIKRNETDISESGYYQYAVLSKVGEGPLAVPEEVQWYEFIWSFYDGIPVLDAVKEIEKPKQYRHIYYGL